MWCVCVCEDCVYEGNVQRCVGVWEFKKRKVHRKKGKKEKSRVLRKIHSICIFKL